MDHEMLKKEDNAVSETPELPVGAAEIGIQTSRKISRKTIVSKEALLVAGSILLGSLIIAGAVLTASIKNRAALSALPSSDSTNTAQNQPNTKSNVTLDQIKALFDGKNITFGDKDRKVIFVEFSDPSCPFCHAAAGKNPALNKKMGPRFTLASDGGTYVAPVPEMKKLVDAGKASFVWIYANGHGNGEMGTKALYCAQEQGKFWATHDLLMSEAGFNVMNNLVKNDKAKTGVLVNFLKGALDASQLKSCLDSDKYEDRLTSDMALAQQFGFQGTPDFFINTENFSGAYSFKDLQVTVDKYLK